MRSITRTITAIGLALFVGSEALSGAHPIGDPAVGKAKSAICAGCHGSDGNSQLPIHPNLADQDAEYIVRQLEAFKAGTRQNSTMNGIAAGLSEADMAALAAYFSDQTLKSAGGDPQLAKKGQAEYKDKACWSCHGSNALGQEGYPRLAGQHPEYTVRQFQNFKNGSRNNPAMKGVIAIIANMSDADMKAIAAYLGSLNAK